MEWPGYDAYNNPPVMVGGRPARGRPRHGSDFPRQTMYFTDANGMLIPQGAGVMGRSNSVSGGRPPQVIINNTQLDELSPPHTSRSRRTSGYDDDSWDERAHSPHRHRHQSRDRSRRRSRDHSRQRSRDRSHDRRRHSHSHHYDHESRSPSPYWDYETERKMKKLEELERKEEEEAARERAKQEMIIADAKKAAKKKEEEDFKKRVLEEAEREKYEKQMKEKKKKEEEDKTFKARLKEMYLAQGYSEESIEIMINDHEKKKQGHVSPNQHSPHALGGHAHGGHDGAMVRVNEPPKVVDLNRPTYIKVHRKYLSPDTLDAYDLPWEWDDRDSNYIVIKRWINENDQDKLFEHTRKLREQRLLTNSAPVELKKENGKLKLVREKSPARSRSHSRSWMFT
ncbi:MAG: hypothetical protein Q9183_001410 [Haloplaca sp. 2 TL-2023]